MTFIEKTIFYQTRFGIGIGLYAWRRVAGGMDGELGAFRIGGDRIIFGTGRDPIAFGGEAVFIIQRSGYVQPAVCPLVVEWG